MILHDLNDYFISLSNQLIDLNKNMKPTTAISNIAIPIKISIGLVFMFKLQIDEEQKN